VEINDIISSGLLELYAAGLTSESETTQVQVWVKQYPEVAAELHAIEMGIEDYANINAITPTNDVKQKIFAEINTISQTNKIVDEPAKVIGINNYWKWAAAASVALLITSAIGNMLLYNNYTAANKNLQNTQQQLAIAEEKSNEIKTDLDVVHSPYSVPVSLVGQQTTPDAIAKIFWMKNTGEVMVDASNLPDAPAGKQYQFWAIVDGVPVDGGLIITTDKGKKFRMQKMKAFGKAQAFAISLEKEGGNPTPTAVVSMGKI
jgi:anti-sigma-K factor RskA